MILRIGIRVSLGIAAGALLLWTAAAQQQPSKPGDLGFTDTPILPGLKWHVHDPDRPHPPVVTPGATPFAPPSDAIVPFARREPFPVAPTEQYFPLQRPHVTPPPPPAGAPRGAPPLGPPSRPLGAFRRQGSSKGAQNEKILAVEQHD